MVATSQPPSAEEAAKHKVEATMMQMKASTENLKQLAELIDAGKLKTIVAKTYPLAQARDAWTEIMSGHARGKIVLEVAGSH